MQESLLTEKNTETIKETCRKMIDLVPRVITEGKEYNQSWNQASREFHRGIEYPGDREDIVFVSPMPFKRLAIIYEKEGDLDKAISVCLLALSLGLDNDGTKAGMTGRLEKLKKKAGC